MRFTKVTLQTLLVVIGFFAVLTPCAWGQSSSDINKPASIFDEESYKASRQNYVRRDSGPNNPATDSLWIGPSDSYDPYGEEPRGSSSSASSEDEHSYRYHVVDPRSGPLFPMYDKRMTEMMADTLSSPLTVFNLTVGLTEPMVQKAHFDSWSYSTDYSRRQLEAEKVTLDRLAQLGPEGLSMINTYNNCKYDLQTARSNPATPPESIDACLGVIYSKNILSGSEFSRLKNTGSVVDGSKRFDPVRDNPNLPDFVRQAASAGSANDPKEYYLADEIFGRDCLSSSLDHADPSSLNYKREFLRLAGDYKITVNPQRSNPRGGAVGNTSGSIVNYEKVEAWPQEQTLCRDVEYMPAETVYKQMFQATYSKLVEHLSIRCRLGAQEQQAWQGNLANFVPLNPNRSLNYWEKLDLVSRSMFSAPGYSISEKFGELLYSKIVSASSMTHPASDVDCNRIFGSGSLPTADEIYSALGSGTPTAGGKPISPTVRLLTNYSRLLSTLKQLAGYQRLQDIVAQRSLSDPNRGLAEKAIALIQIRLTNGKNSESFNLPSTYAANLRAINSLEVEALSSVNDGSVGGLAFGGSNTSGTP